MSRVFRTDCASEAFARREPETRREANTCFVAPTKREHKRTVVGANAFCPVPVPATTCCGQRPGPNTSAAGTGDGRAAARNISPCRVVLYVIMVIIFPIAKPSADRTAVEKNRTARHADAYYATIGCLIRPPPSSSGPPAAGIARTAAVFF